MQEDRIDSYIDRDGIKQDTKFMLDELNQVLQAFNKVNGVEVKLKVANGKEVVTLSNELAAANKVLENSTKQLTNATKTQADAELKLAKVKTEEAKQTKELSAAKVNEAKATTENAKAKELELKYTTQLSKEKEKLEKASTSEQKSLEKLNNAYEQLKAKYTIAANTAKRLAAEELNVIATEGAHSKAVSEAAKNTKDAQVAADGYYQQLVKIERAVGQSQRTVGQYERAQFALSQVIREAPAFMNSFQTGLLGISNNIPILIDEYNKLKESTGSTSQSFGILAKSLFSPINLISIGIAILPKLIEKVGEWTGATKSAADAQKEAAEKGQLYNEVLKKQLELLGSDVKGVNNIKDRIRLTQNEIDTAEKQGTSQASLFAKKKTLAQLEKQLADDKAQTTAASLVTNYKEVSATKSNLDILAGLQGDFNLQLNSLLEQQKNPGLSKESLEALQSQEGSVRSSLENINSALTNSFKAQQNIQDIQAEEAKFNADERRKLTLESTKIEVDLIRTKNDLILNDDRSTLDQRLAALKANQAAQKRVIEAEKNDVLNNPESSTIDRTLAIKKAAAEERNLELQTRTEIFELKESFRVRDLEATKAITEQRQEIEIETDKVLLNSTLLTLEERLKAQAQYSDSQRKLLEEDFGFKLKTAGFSDKEVEAIKRGEQAQVDGKKLTLKELSALQVEYETGILKLAVFTNEGITEIIKTNLQKQQGLREESLKEIERLYKNLDLSNSTQYANEVIALNEALTKKEISLREYNKRREKIDQQFQQTSLQNLASSLQSQLSEFINAEEKELQAKQRVEDLKQQLANTTNDDEKKDILNKLSVANEDYKIAKANVDKKIDLENRLADATIKASDKSTDKIKQNIKDALDLLKQQAEEIKNLALSFATDNIDREKNEIQDQLDLLDEKKAKDIEVANQSITNAQDRASAIAVIEARAAAEKDRLEKRQRQLDIERARFEKAKTIADIIQKTTIAVMHQLSSGDPFTAVVRAVVVGALGAAQLARAISAPLPKFKDGKRVQEGQGKATDYYEGYAWVGDGGKSELMIHEDGSMEVTPSKPVVTHVKKNDIILPDAQKALKGIGNSVINKTATLTTTKIEVYDFEKVRAEVKQSGRNIVNAIERNKQKPNHSHSALMKLWISSNISGEDFIKRI
jgi:hypothetical protein